MSVASGMPVDAALVLTQARLGTALLEVRDEPDEVEGVPVRGVLRPTDGPSLAEALAVASEAGLSGVVVIAESHIAVHTWPEREWLRVDICSCKAFPHVSAIQFIIERLGISQMQRVAVDFEDGGPALRPRAELPLTPWELPIHHEVLA